MDLLRDLPGFPAPSQAVSALAAFVRQRLAEVGDLLTPRWVRPDDVPVAARQLATVIAGAAAPFAPTSYARARLLRQLYATGLLTELESEQAIDLLSLAR